MVVGCGQGFLSVTRLLARKKRPCGLSVQVLLVQKSCLSESEEEGELKFVPPASQVGGFSWKWVFF